LLIDGNRISTIYGAGPDQTFLDSPKAEWLWEYAQAKDVLVHVHPPLVSIGAASMQQYRLIEAVDLALLPELRNLDPQEPSGSCVEFPESRLGKQL
jgi:hypothetical protein